MILITPLIGANETMRISAQDASLKQSGTSPIPKAFAIENFGIQLGVIQGCEARFTEA